VRGFLAVLLAATGVALNSADTAPNAETILGRSMLANQTNWAAAPDYSYFDRAKDEVGIKTYEVTMMLGSPYKRVVKIDDKPLDAAEQQKAEEAQAKELTRRRAESAVERARRIDDYQKKRDLTRKILEQMPRAFTYRLGSTSVEGSRTVYVLLATPREGYAPPTTEAQVLTGMRAELWVDTTTYQWVRARARVLRPVSVAGFLIKVQPGTEFELEQMPVEEGVWLPRHLEMRSRSSVFFVFRHNGFEEHTYFDYKRTPAAP
jgi:hypothetical protein